MEWRYQRDCLAQVHIRDEMFVVNCGNGQQRIEWLGDTVCHRYDPHYLWDVGPVQDIKLKNGVMVNLKGIICEELQDDVHVYIQLIGKDTESPLTCLHFI